MIVKPGRVKPANVALGHTRGWTFTVIIHGIEFEPVGLNKNSAAKTKEHMCFVVDQLNKKGEM